jgi:hypothetical protein
MVLSGKGVQLFMYTFYMLYSMKYTGQYIVITFSTFRTGPFRTIRTIRA